jgi:hypothetical protein
MGLFMLIMSCNNTADNKENASVKPEEAAIPAKEIVFDKLVGTWQSRDGNNFERWTKNDNGTYQSVVFSLKGMDTILNEQASIYQENNNWVFENRVKGQNDGRAIKFTSSILEGSRVQFSNHAHDFPTDINYSVTDTNTLDAFIVGPNSKGGKDTIPFNYIRIK